MTNGALGGLDPRRSPDASMSGVLGGERLREGFLAAALVGVLVLVRGLAARGLAARARVAPVLEVVAMVVWVALLSRQNPVLFFGDEERGNEASRNACKV